MTTPDSAEEALRRARLKQQAADHAATLVESGMVVGLGVGSTAILFVRRLAERLHAGDVRDIVGIPCSLQVEAEARQLGLPLTTLEEQPVVDLTVDGADEVDPALNLIKGGGGALLREKIVAQSSRREVIIVDAAKLSPVLGTNWALPIEVVPFGWGAQARYLESLGAEVTLRRLDDGSPFVTDQGNLILDSNFGPIGQPDTLNERLNARVGIVEHGLFLGLASEVIVASNDGLQQLKRETPA
jgi:ribose 5-phosphate isomerase A